MSFTLSSWSIRNPIPPIVLFLVLTVAGLIAYIKLPINNMPSVVIPVVNITISQPGASPLEMEAQITRKIESAIAGLQGVKHITSTVTQGQSSTAVEFFLENDFDRAVNDTRDAVSNIREQLPRSILEPIIQRIEYDGGAILTYSIEAPEMRPEDLSWYVDDTVSREMMSVKGVAKIERNGGVDHEITITLDPNKLEAFGVSAAEISRQLTAVNVDLPGGRVIVDEVERTIRTLGATANVETLQNTMISLGNGRPVKLSTLGHVTDGGAEIRNLTRLNGKPVVTFQVYRTKGSSEVSVARLVEKKLEEMQKKNPSVRYTQIFSIVKFTETSFRSALYAFIEGSFLTVLVVLWFLRDRRATILAALAIPLSIIPTFLVIYLLGFTLNALSLLAISLVTGVLVDDAIVEIENIHRHLKQGTSPYKAAMVAADEIGLAVVATTFVICAVFLPVSFMDGITGQFFKQFGLTVAIAAFFSLVVARLLTPLLAAYFFLNHDPEEDKPGFWLTRYHALVEWTLSNRRKTLMLAAVTLVLSFAMIPLLKTGFIPYEDYAESSLVLELPSGATLEETDEAAQKIVNVLRKRSEVVYVLSTVSDSADGGLNKANITMKLTPREKRVLDQRAFENDVLPALKKFPDMRISFANNAGQKDMAITLVSEDIPALSTSAAALEKQMRAMPGLSSIVNSEGQKQPEIRVVPDFDKAARLGITAEQISDAIRVATIGDNANSLAKFNYGTHQIPIRLRFPKQNYETVATVENLRIPTAQGYAVPLKAIAEIDYGTGPTTIQRYDRQRRISIEANLNGAALGEMLKKIHELPVVRNLPDTVHMENMGDVEAMQELFEGFGMAICAGLLMVYAIQVLLYKDWLQPLTRMAALPLSIGGAFFLLLLTGTELNLPVFIGILMLMGIADKNSILLVDYMLELIKQGKERREAIVTACMTRARPIIMTSFAMLAGMMPIALGIGVDTAFRAPMAIAVIGGLISSTALSLVFVPVLFSYVRDFEDWIEPKLGRVVANHEEDMITSDS